MTTNPRITRRAWLAGTSAAAIYGGLGTQSPAAVADKAKPKSVAAIITVYRKGSHADVIVGKILEGWIQQGGPGPALSLASMYVEQIGDDDLPRGISKKYDVPMFPTIEEAVTVGQDRIPVDGVISIGEHGSYPFNDKQQHLYPRRRFFKEN